MSPNHPQVPGVDYPGVSVTFFCHDGTGRFVMHRRSPHARDEQHRWDFGGGRLEIHDTIENTVRKEIKEEYCADALDLEFLGFRDVHREHNGQKTHWIALDYKVRIDPAQVKIGEPDKFTDLRWFTLATLPPEHELHSQLPTYFAKYRDRL